MPREVVDALKKSGHWQEGAGITGAVCGASHKPAYEMIAE